MSTANFTEAFYALQKEMTRRLDAKPKRKRTMKKPTYMLTRSGVERRLKRAERALAQEKEWADRRVTMANNARRSAESVVIAANNASHSLRMDLASEQAKAGPRIEAAKADAFAEGVARAQAEHDNNLLCDFVATYAAASKLRPTTSRIPVIITASTGDAMFRALCKAGFTAAGKQRGLML